MLGNLNHMLSSLPLRRVSGFDSFPRQDRWPFTVASIRTVLNQGINFSPLTLIIGENGTGKSVLLESIAEAFGFPSEGGTLAEQRDSIEDISACGNYLQLVRGASGTRNGLFFRAETVHSLQVYLQSVGSSRGSKLLRQSHGESALSLIDSVPARQGLWIFDEPESGLSFQGQLNLIHRLLEHLRGGGQVILCTHSPILMGMDDDAQMLEVGEWGIHETVFENIEDVTLWRSFLQAPDRFMQHF